MASERRFGQVFDGVAAAYDDVRPGYPPELVATACDRGGLKAGSRVLELGCGTGKLTELLVERGLVVDAVDPGPNMVEAARKRIGPTDRVTFHIARFEDADLPREAFAAVFSATAFHWLDPGVSWRKAASHLEPSGLIALLTHVGLHDDHGAEDEFRAALNKHAAGIAEGWHPSRDLATILGGAAERRDNASRVWDWVMGDGRHELVAAEAADLFEDVDVAAVVLEDEKTADELIAHFRTTSLYFRIDPAQLPALEADDRRIVERRGGTVRFSLAAMLMTARLKTGPVGAGETAA
jgi:SAM-dependent methyltransferase